MAELKLDEELNDLIDDIIADSKLSEEEFELLKDEFAERDLDIKDYLNELDAVFQQRLADGGKNIVKFNIYWKAYRFKFEKNINTDKLTEDNLSVVFDKDFEDLLNATIMDGKIDKNEMSALAAECQKNNLSLQDLGVLLEERLELIDSSKLDRFRISWKARLDEYQRENNNAAQIQPEPAKSASSSAAETTAVTPAAATTHSVPYEQSSDDDFRRKKKNNSEPKNEEKFEFNTESAKKVVKKIGVAKIALVAVCLIVCIVIVVNIVKHSKMQIKNDTQVTGPDRIAANARFDEKQVLIDFLTKLNNSENGWGGPLEKAINDKKIPNEIKSILKEFDSLSDERDNYLNDQYTQFCMSKLKTTERFITQSERIIQYLKPKVGDIFAINLAKVIPYWCVFFINAGCYDAVISSTSTFSKYLNHFVKGQQSLDYKDANVICYYFCSMIYGTEQGFWSRTFEGNKNKEKLKSIFNELEWWRDQHKKDIGENGGLRDYVMYLNTVEQYLQTRINDKSWFNSKQGNKLEWFQAETY